ncbi:MFS multidrug transporter [Diplogelasinospora grovesii]|uniref:MFS multidrug transporter n=1 Tax=Diplogelasinospora grovesii TaxID=303347 RepID=A0AAN6NJH4_9PEZI|nr:MFS multidrug transporter [Diplogelasinospora grovesii]
MVSGQARDHNYLRAIAMPLCRLSRRAWFCIALTILLETSHAILTVPVISLYERVICDRYYAGQDPPQWPTGLDDRCKTPLIQAEVALVRGWQGFFNGLSALLVALPMGYITDHHSHRKAFAFILGGLIAAILWTILVCAIPAVPIRLVWMTSLFYLCGGGNYAAEMMIGVMLVNSCSEADRTRNLYYMYSAFIFTELVGPPFARWSASIAIWIPFAIGVICLCACFPVLAIMPESTSLSAASTASNQEVESNDRVISIPNMHRRLSSILGLFNSWNMYWALPMFFAGTFRNVSIRALLQYTHVRLGWELVDTNALITEVASVNLILFFFILPTIITFVNGKYKPHPQSLNLGIIRISFGVLVGGSLLIAFSNSSAQLLVSLAIYACGFGARATLLSLVTSWHDASVRARIYSAILLVELFGMLAWEPLLQGILAISFALPRLWMGLPFLVCSIGYLCALTASFLIRLQLKLPDQSSPRSAEAEEIL